MPAPSSVTYAASIIVSAHTAVLNAIDAGSSVGKFRFYDDTDNLLGEVLLDDPAGTVNGTTGTLTLSIDVPQTVTDDGTCTYADITDSDNNVIVSIPVEEGDTAVSGKIVVNTVAFVTGASLDVLSASIG
jgi:hypothetical protein